MKARTNDFAIRAALVRRLLAAGTTRASIRHEITLDSNSSDGRADMVVLRPDALVGVEIKSGKDTLNRLITQRPRYAARFDRMVLAFDPRHAKAVNEAQIIYRGWDTLEVGWQGDGSDLDAVRDRSFGWDVLTKTRGSWWSSSGHLSAGAMLEMLHAVEIQHICRECRCGHETRSKGIPWLAEEIPLAKLRLLVSGRLKARGLNRWEEKFWKAFDAAAPAVAA